MNIPMHMGYTIAQALKDQCRQQIRNHLKYRRSGRGGLRHMSAIDLAMAKQTGEALNRVRSEFHTDMKRLMGEAKGLL